MKKPALLLNSLDGCGRCGVERRFRLSGGTLRCETCGLALSEARLAAPIVTPPEIAANPPLSPASANDTTGAGALSAGSESGPSRGSSPYGDPW